MKYFNKYSDIRIFHAIEDAKKSDKSFTEKENVFSLLGGGIRYTQAECRKFWFDAMAIGMEMGLHKGSLHGQRIDLYNNCKNERQKEFLDKFYKLAQEYNCAIVYHPVDGMCVMDLDR